MGNNDFIVIQRGRGKKEIFNNIDRVSVKGNKVFLEGDLVSETFKAPRRFNILLNGEINNLISPSEETKKNKVKKLIAGHRIYNMEVYGVLPKLCLKDSNVGVGIYTENIVELVKPHINMGGDNKDSFTKFFISGTEVFESFIKNISKETKLGEVKKKVEDMLHFFKKAEKAFTSFSFAPYLNSIIRSLSSILRKCNETPSKKVSCIWFNNLIVKHNINRVVNSMQ